MGEPTAAPAAPPATKLGPADMSVEASPTTATEDKKARKEWAALFGSMLEYGTARVIGIYVDIALRAGMAGAFFWLTRDWLLGVLKILENQQAIPAAVERLPAPTHLSDPVLITLLTTTTLNVLGLLIAVAAYLFPRKVVDKLAAAAQESATK